MANSLVPDKARHLVKPDLGPNCLQKSTTDNTSRQNITTTVFLLFQESGSEMSRFASIQDKQINHNMKMCLYS